MCVGFEMSLVCSSVFLLVCVCVWVLRVCREHSCVWVFVFVWWVVGHPEEECVRRRGDVVPRVFIG